MDNSILRFAAASTIVLTGAAFCSNANAQTLSDLLPQQGGTSVYSLPSTSIKLDVEAECVAFTAGPYAKYAQKYFGIDAKTEDGVSYTLSSVKMTPYVEADPNANYSIKLDRKNLMPAFLQFTSQGLVVLSSTGAGQSEIWRFPSQVQGKQQETAGGIESNLTDATTTLYKTVKSDNGSFETVPVQQKQLVAKTEEQKAAETAELIFTLRQSRNNIVTGNTDATFSGEALEAAVKEINRLEKEYLSMKRFPIMVSSVFLFSSFSSFIISPTGLIPFNKNMLSPSDTSYPGTRHLTFSWRESTSSDCPIIKRSPPNPVSIRYSKSE